jgi:hypothetical protein
MEWVQYPTILKSTKTGKFYLRLEVGTFKNVKTKTQFLLDGQEVAKSDYEHCMLGSETKKSERFGTFNVGAENILKVHEFVCEVKVEDEDEDEAETV